MGIMKSRKGAESRKVAAEAARMAFAEAILSDQEESFSFREFLGVLPYR